MGAAPPTREPAAADAGSFSEFCSRWRGRLRRCLYEHPRSMDVLVVAAHLLLAVPAAGGATVHGLWLPSVLVVPGNPDY